MFVKKKKFNALLKRVEDLENALRNGRILTQPSRTYVLQPGGFANTVVEGPIAGSTSYDKGQFSITLQNPSPH